MNKDFKAILAVLLLEALAVSDDGKFTLTKDQMQALNDRLAELGADKQLAEDKVKELTEQVSALQKADGDETTHVEGDGEQVENHAAAARADYEKLKSIL